MLDQALRDALRQAYARNVEYREGLPLEDWKAVERRAFLARLQAEKAATLLEIGAGPGRDSAFFAGLGLRVLASDIVLKNAAACRRKGLASLVSDACAIPLPAASFDAAFTLNCLLHLPRAEFSLALQNVQRILKPGGLFYLGQYGGPDREAVWEEDLYQPPRFFCFYSDSNLLETVARYFEIEAFKQISLRDSSGGLHFQSLALRRITPTSA